MKLYNLCTIGVQASNISLFSDGVTELCCICTCHDPCPKWATHTSTFVSLSPEQKAAAVYYIERAGSEFLVLIYNNCVNNVIHYNSYLCNRAVLLLFIRSHDILLFPVLMYAYAKHRPHCQIHCHYYSHLYLHI